MQKKHDASGKFSAFLSYVQRKSPEAVKFLNDKGVNFPVYNQVRLPHAPCGRGIPHGVLMDHTGKVVATGHFSRLASKIEELIKATPDPIPEILGDVTVKHCKSQAKRLGGTGSISMPLKELDRYAKRDNDKGKEAKAMAEAVRSWLDKEQTRLKELVGKQPARAALSLEAMVKRIKGLEGEEAMKAELKALAADKDVVALVKIVKGLDKVQAKIDDKGKSKSTERDLAKVKKKLAALLSQENLSEAVSAEAKALHDSL